MRVLRDTDTNTDTDTDTERIRRYWRPSTRYASAHLNIIVFAEIFVQIRVQFNHYLSVEYIAGVFLTDMLW